MVSKEQKVWGRNTLPPRLRPGMGGRFRVGPLSLLCHTVQKRVFKRVIFRNLEKHTISFTVSFFSIFFSVFTETSQLEMFLLHQTMLWKWQILDWPEMFTRMISTSKYHQWVVFAFVSPWFVSVLIFALSNNTGNRVDTKVTELAFQYCE